jgi:plasmid stability protein
LSRQRRYFVVNYAEPEPHVAMTSIIIPNVDDDLEQRLKVRAAEHGRSIEAEARAILRLALGGNGGEGATPGNLGDSIRAIVEPVGGIELDIPPRKQMREPPKFE